MATFGDVWYVGGLSLPAVPIELRRYVGRGKRTTGLVFAHYDVNVFESTDAPLPNQFAGEPKAAVAALPTADLNDTASFADDLSDSLAFVDGEREWLFAVNVTARAAGVDEHRRVPMVGRANRDHIDVVAVQHVAIVVIEIGLAAEILTCLFGNPTVDVTDGDDVAMFDRLVGDHRPLIFHADRADAETIVFRLQPGAGFGVGSEVIRHR